MEYKYWADNVTLAQRQWSIRGALLPAGKLWAKFLRLERVIAFEHQIEISQSTLSWLLISIPLQCGKFVSKKDWNGPCVFHVWENCCTRRTHISRRNGSFLWALPIEPEVHSSREDKCSIRELKMQVADDYLVHRQSKPWTGSLYRVGWGGVVKVLPEEREITATTTCSLRAQLLGNGH